MTLSLASPIIRDSLSGIRANLGTMAELANARLFITGGTGFFGKWLLALIALLNEEGLNISATLLSRNPNSFLQQEPGYIDTSWLSWVIGDVRDFPWPEQDFDYVIHGATETSVSAHKDSLDIFDSIVTGGKRVLDLAVRAKVRRILIIGSGAQYGPLPVGIDKYLEDCGYACDSACSRSAYGEGKRAVETLAAIYHERHGIEPVFARCFTFVGPGLPLNTHFAIGNFIRDALEHEAIIVHGDGTALRSYLYAADLAVWLLRLLLKGEAGKAYNVGSDVEVSIGELAHLVRQTIAPKKPVRILGETDSKKHRNQYIPCIDRARQLELMPWTSLHAGICKTSIWLDTTPFSLYRYRN
jgi:nucleoside-diphosphate-sugar epimerase